MNESVKVYQERDLRRLGACDRVQQTRTDAKAASEQAKEAASGLESEAMAAWSRHNEAKIHLDQLLNPQFVIKNEQAGGIDAVECGSTSSAAMSSNRPHWPADAAASVVETTKTIVTQPDSLTEREASVWCLAYTEERRALIASSAFSASERARDAANAAVKAFREAAES